MYKAQKIRKQIGSFMNLSAGWHYGEGVMISSRAKDSALDVTEILQTNNAQDMDAFPCPDGGVLVSGYYNNDVVYVECLSCGMLDISLEEGKIVKDEKTKQNLNDLENFLKGLKWEVKKSCVYSTLNSSTKVLDDLQVPLSGIQVMEEFQSLIKNVHSSQAEPYVLIFRNFTKASQEVLPSRGRSMSMNFHKKANLQMKHLRAEIPVTGTFVH